MKDKNHNKLPAWAIGLLIALLAVVGIQSAWLYLISDHLKTTRPTTTKSGLYHGQKEDAQTPSPNKTPLEAPAISMDEWNPFQEMQRMREEMDRMFGDALGRFGSGVSLNRAMGEEFAHLPDLEIAESEDEYTVEVDISGMVSPKINTELSGQSLTIHVASDSEKENSAQGNHVATKEHRIESYSRSILFDQPVETDGMTEEVDGGMLRVHVPKLHG